MGAHISLVMLPAIVARHLPHGRRLRIAGAHLTVIGVPLVVLLRMLVVVLLHHLEALLGLLEGVIRLRLLPLLRLELLALLALLQLLLPAAFESIQQILRQAIVIELPPKGFYRRFDDTSVEPRCVQVNVDFLYSATYHVHLFDDIY